MTGTECGGRPATDERGSAGIGQRLSSFFHLEWSQRAATGIGSIAILLVWPACGFAQQAEPEVQCVEGPEVAIGDGEHTVGCEINPGSDVDIFTFFGVGGDLFRFSLADLSNSNFDPRIEIRDPMGTLIADESATNSPLQFDLLLPQSTGIYFVAVSEDNQVGTTTYVLHLGKIPPTLPPSPLVQDQSLAEAVQFGADLDFFCFRGAYGTIVRLSLADLTNSNFDPHLEVRDPFGTVIADEIAMNSGLQVDLDLFNSGEFLVLVSEDNLVGVTNYSLELNCLFGICSPTTECHTGIFADGFESGETSAWSSTVP